jgi:hypothetical protein
MNDSILIVEDGHEYLDRFTRFLGGEFGFLRADDAASALAACTKRPRGLLFDLDFRRVPPERLIDESGRPAPHDAHRVSPIQGILILRALRAASIELPALLFADLDDPARARFLEESLAPLAVVPSNEALSSIAARLRRWPPSR